MKKLLLFTISVLITSTLFGQLTGIKTIPGTYATIAAAITDLNLLGVGAGGVTFTGFDECFTKRKSNQVNGFGRPMGK